MRDRQARGPAETGPLTTLGQAIRRARTEKGLTGYDLAEELGIHFGSLSDIERDRRVPSMDLIGRFAEALDLDFDELRARAGRLTEQEWAYLRTNPKALALVRAMMDAAFGEQEIERLIGQVTKARR